MRVKLAASMFLMVVFSVQTNAQPSGTAASQQPQASQAAPVSPEDAEKAREQVKELGKVFGIEPAQPAAVVQANGKEKTVAEVADKALDLVSNLVGSVASTLQKVAPDVWRILIKQQYARAFGNLIFPWGAVALLLVYKKLAYKGWTVFIDIMKPDSDKDDKELMYWRLWTAQIIPTALMVVFCAFGLYALSNSVMYVINPEYYAVRDLLQLILNPKNPAQ